MPGSTASGVRWRICGLLFLIVVLTFLDRINISVAARYMQLEFALDNRQLGYVLSAYVLGYGLFQIPGGLLGDRWGPRKLLTFAVLWWSVFTALTAVAPRLAAWVGLGLLPGLLIARFLVGVGEAASLPNSNKVVASWMPAHERGTGNSMFLAGVGVGGAISPPLIAWIMSAWGWRSRSPSFGGGTAGITRNNTRMLTPANWRSSRLPLPASALGFRRHRRRGAPGYATGAFGCW